MTTDDLNARVTRLEATYEHLATKEDVANLRSDMQTEMGNMRADMAHMRADMAHMKADLIRWTVGAVIGGLTAAVGLTALILRVLGPWT